MTEEVSEYQKIDALSQIGFQPSEIAIMLGLTPNAVRIRLFKIRKKNRRES
jgi:DNA-directed RNA polymerase specialized sigma24 family protein